MIFLKFILFERLFLNLFTDGFFSPDMAKMSTVLKKAKHREYMYQQQHYYYKLLQEILVSRKVCCEKLLLDAIEVDEIFNLIKYYEEIIRNC